MKNSWIKIALVWGYVLGWVAVGAVKKYREAGKGSKVVSNTLVQSDFIVD